MIETRGSGLAEESSAFFDTWLSVILNASQGAQVYADQSKNTVLGTCSGVSFCCTTAC